MAMTDTQFKSWVQTFVAGEVAKITPRLDALEAKLNDTVSAQALLRADFNSQRDSMRAGLDAITSTQNSVLAAISKIGTGAGTGMGGGGTGTGGGTTPLPTTPILTMPDGIPDGASYEVGDPSSAVAVDIAVGIRSVGPDYVTPQEWGHFAVLLNDVIVARGLKASRYAWQASGPYQAITLYGNWALKPTDKWTFAPAADFPRYYEIPHFSVNSIGMYSTMYRAFLAYFSDNISCDWVYKAQLDIMFPPTPPVVPTAPSIIKGAKNNGTVLPDGEFQTVVAACQPGTLVLPDGKYSGTARINVPLTIKSESGNPTVTLDAAGIDLTKGMAILVPMVPGCHFEGLIGINAACPDRNGAFIRSGVMGIGWTWKNCEAHNCQDGVLDADGDYLLEGGEITGCGLGEEGQQHAAYIGGVYGEAQTDETGTEVPVPSKGTTTFRKMKIGLSPGGHGPKSRALVTNIEGCDIPSGDVVNNASVIDIPNGGTVNIGPGADGTPTVVTMLADGNHYAFTYAMEYKTNGLPLVKPVMLIDSTKVSYAPLIGGRHALIINGQVAHPDGVCEIDLTGITWKGQKPSVVGWDKVTGEMTQVA